MADKNIIMNFLRSLVDLFSADEAPIERSVSLEDIGMTIQSQLDAEAGTPVVSPDGEETMVGDGSSYVLDVHTDGKQVFAIITKSDGKLYKVPVNVSADNAISTGEYQEVTMEFTPVASRQLSVKRAADGTVRWFAMPACTAVLNRSGEIDSMALFDSFVDHIDRTKEYPELDFFHLGEQLTLGKTDWVGRDGVAYCASGTFYDTPIARAAIDALEADPNYWGLSIAYITNQEPEMIRSSDGVAIPVYNFGINRFISLLPENTAA